MGRLVFVLFVIFVLSLSLPTSTGSFEGPNPKDISEWVRNAKEKVTHIHFYLHDTLTGSNPTTIKIAESKITNTSRFLFGLLHMIDNPLTEGPNLTSKLVGRAQGLSGLTGMEEFRLVMAVNLVFTTGEFNGSTLSILASNPILENPRELPIVGGTGVFRLARGFVVLNTYQFNMTTGDSILEYDVVAIHY